MLVVAEDEWRLHTDVGEPRTTRLLSPPPPDELLAKVREVAAQGASSLVAQLKCREANGKPGFFRVEGVIPLPEEVFDWLFNGCSGYRAKYYLSPASGFRYNRAVVDGIAKIIATKTTSEGKRLDFTMKSLSGSQSKIWVFGDWAAFLREPNVLLPKRWVDYWATTQDEPFGLKAPLPTSPALDLKGTFIHPKTGEEWLDPRKAARSEAIFRTGWT